jgi:hypothetical protein
MFGGEYFGKSMWSKTANAPCSAMAAGRLPNSVGDEFLSIARIGVVTKENLREPAINRPISLFRRLEQHPRIAGNRKPDYYSSAGFLASGGVISPPNF